MLRFERETPPLAGTLGRAEVEFAAALVLWALRELGRDWLAPISRKEFDDALAAAITSGRDPVWTWACDPKLRPHYAELVRLGLAVREETPAGDVLRLEPALIERLGDHLLPAEAGPKERTE